MSSDIQVGGSMNVSAMGSIDVSSMNIQELYMAVMLERANLLDGRVRDQANEVRAKNDELKLIAQLMSEARVNQNQSQTIVDEPTWQVDGNTIKLDNGYTLEMEGEHMAWKLKDAEGNEVRIHGDPHVTEGDGGTWDFKQNGTFVLEDGTKITVNTTPWSGNPNMTVTESLTITRGNQAITVSGIDQNNPQISGPNLNGMELDANTNDGYIFREMGNVGDWSFEGNEIDGSGTGTREQVAWSGAQTHEEVTENIPVMSEQLKALLDKHNIAYNDPDGDGALSPKEWDNVCRSLKDVQDSLTSTSQLEMAQLQSTMGKYNQTYESLSNFTSKWFQSLNTITGNIR